MVEPGSGQRDGEVMIDFLRRRRVVHSHRKARELPEETAAREGCEQDVRERRLPDGVRMYVWRWVDGYRVRHQVDEDMHPSLWRVENHDGRLRYDSHFNEIDYCSDVGEFDDPFEPKDISNTATFLHNVTSLESRATDQLRFHRCSYPDTPHVESNSSGSRSVFAEQDPAAPTFSNQGLDGALNQQQDSEDCIETVAAVDNTKAKNSAPLPVVHGSGQGRYENMDTFFQRCETAREKALRVETDSIRQSRLQREKNAESRIAPGRKGAKVFIWDEVEEDVWIRVPAGRDNYSSIWEDYAPTQRRYDSVANEWDLCTLFDGGAEPEVFDDERDMNEDRDSSMEYMRSLHSTTKDKTARVLLSDSMDDIPSF
ncbi:hypothetical protein MPER_11748, partial [Moniliophthora perniciosa FA553]